MNDIEKRARELLAAEYRKLGQDAFADLLYNTDFRAMEVDKGAISAIIAALTPPEGYVLVPVEPTVEMMETVQAYQCDHSSFRDWRQTEWPDVLGTWRAMLAARPEVP